MAVLPVLSADLPDAAVKKIVPCFGASFEYLDEQCVKCHVQSRCATRVMTAAVPSVLKEAGLPVDATDVQLAKAYDTAVENVAVMRLIAAGMSLDEAAASVAPETEDDEPAPPVVEPFPPALKVKKQPPKKTAPAPQQIDLEDAIAAIVPETVPDALTLVLSTPPPAPPADVVNEKEDDMAPTTTKKKPPAKKAPAKAQVTHAPGKVPEKPKTKVAPVKAPKPSPSTLPTEEAQWARERKRSTFVAGLPAGAELERMYEGKRITVLVHTQSYTLKVDGKVLGKYPTITKAIAAVTGTTTYGKDNPRTYLAFSIARFFSPSLSPGAANLRKAPRAKLAKQPQNEKAKVTKAKAPVAKKKQAPKGKPPKKPAKKAK